MKSSASSSSSYDSFYFSAIPSPFTRENSHGEEDSPMESPSSSSAVAAASSSSSSASQSSSLDPSSSTRQNTHHDEFISFGGEDIRMESSASSSSSESSCSSSSSSQPSSSNPSTSSGENTHDVFINFRGEDTRHGFVSHLLDALKRNDIRTYMDDCNLERGKEISSTLLKAIEQSKISLIVFSKNYASSRWTLDELVKIMSQRTRGQLVLPIFYKISPSKVRKKGSYSTVLKKPKNLFRSSTNEIEQTNAMKEAADLAGWESSTYKSECELLKVVVNEVKRQLESMSHGSEGLPLQNYSPNEPNSGGSPHHDDPRPQDSSHGTLNLRMARLWNKTCHVLWREDHGRLAAWSLHRNRYLL